MMSVEYDYAFAAKLDGRANDYSVLMCYFIVGNGQFSSSRITGKTCCTSSSVLEML